jgi:hypothetical protein
MLTVIWILFTTTLGSLIGNYFYTSPEIGGLVGLSIGGLISMLYRAGFLEVIAGVFEIIGDIFDAIS